MTKKVKIGHADSSNYKIIVEVWEKRSNIATLISIKELPNIEGSVEQYVYEGRYLIIKEATNEIV